MKQLGKLIQVEAKLFLRDPAGWVFTFLLPTGLLLGLGAVPALRQPDETFGGARFIDLFAPSLIVITLAVLGVNMLPIRLATYREKGILRRLSTTPASPGKLLLAQLVVNTVLAFVSVALLVVVGKLAFDVPLPKQPLGFVAAFVLGLASLFAIGLLVASMARTARVGTALAMPLFFVVMFFGGVYVPRYLLPDILVRIGDYTPPGVQALLDSWSGDGGVRPLQLAYLAAITVIAGGVAARLFRWE
ncbi:ABC transporter permease [Flindersiella endophytica]